MQDSENLTLFFVSKLMFAILILLYNLFNILLKIKKN